MAIKAVILKREELYGLVWSIPLLQLAKRYGLSDRGLAKICKRMEIPLPGVGYWAKLAAGQSLEKVPLEPITVQGLSQYEFFPIEALPAAPPIVVGQSLTDMHSLVTQTKAALDNLKIGSSTQFLINRDQPHLDIRVRPEALERALRIMNAVVLELESNGHVFAIERSHDGFKTLVSADKDQVSIRLSERIGHHNSHDANGKLLSPTYSSTGELELSFDRKNGIRKSWRDLKKRPLEQALGEFVGAIKAIAEENRENRINREIYEERRLKQEQEEAARNKINAEKKDFLSRIERQADYWKRANAIRNYLAGFEDAIAQGLIEIKNQDEFSLWMTTSKSLADELDPITGNWLDSPPGFAKQDPPERVNHYYHSSSTPSYAPWWYVKHAKGWK